MSDVLPEKVSITTAPDKKGPEKDWTVGPIVGNLLHLSWPMVVMETLYVVSQIVDMIWVGRLGSASVAGVGIANIILLLIMSMDFGLIVGVRAMISRYVGGHDMKKATHVAGQAFVLATIWGAFLTVTGVFLAEPMMSVFGVAPEVVREGGAYLRVMFGGWISLEILVMGLYVLQSTGDTMTPMLVELVIRILHVILCPFVVMGYWGFPQMGVAGAAFSNVVSQILGAILCLWFLLKGHTRMRLAVRDFSFSPRTAMNILKIGIPALVMQLQRSLGGSALTWFVIPFGTVAVAAHSLALRVDMFLFMPSMGLGSGAGVLVGQNLGAHQPERAERGAWMAVGIVQVFLLACSFAVFFWADAVMGMFTSDADLVRLGALFLRIGTASYVVLAPATVLQSCIAGAGDTVPNMIISIGMIWCIQLPLAYLLSHIGGLGVFGVRWAIVATTVAGAIAYVAYFRMGRWKAKKI
jgi:putative MATE family efflux protein